jgi:hypothetical protein
MRVCKGKVIKTLAINFTTVLNSNCFQEISDATNGFSLRTHPPLAFFTNDVSPSYQGHASLYTTDSAEDGLVDFEFIIPLLIIIPCSWRTGGMMTSKGMMSSKSAKPSSAE